MGISHFPTLDRAKSAPPPFDLGRAYAAAGKSVGRSAPRVSADDVNLRGSAVAPVRPFILQNFGDDGWQRFLADLEPDARASIMLPTIATNWYPYTSCCAYIDGIYTLADRRSAILRDFAIYNLDYATNVVFRAIFKIGSPEFMVARSDQVWKKFYSHGRMVCDVKPKAARIELHDFPLISANYSRVIAHSIEAVLLKAGAKVKRASQSKSTLDGDRFSEFSYEWT